MAKIKSAVSLFAIVSKCNVMFIDILSYTSRINTTRRHQMYYYYLDLSHTMTSTERKGYCSKWDITSNLPKCTLS